MQTILNDVEARILGSLIEKEITTPEYYPITLNALTNACNQKSNRDPVVLYEQTTVARGLDRLRDKGLAITVHEAGSRAPKYKHSFREKFGLTQAEVAILCELMLRGPQTIGEIKARANRMYNFKEGLKEVEEILQGLMESEEPRTVKLPRQAGKKENRYMHLFSGEPEIRQEEQILSLEAATLKVRTEDERIAKLEEELRSLRCDFDDLKQAFITFKSEFE
ncbi:DUF480 domain-containing protein [bacterium]|nr:DUF480 domain-containing protein [bacterium]